MGAESSSNSNLSKACSTLSSSKLNTAGHRLEAGETVAKVSFSRASQSGPYRSSERSRLNPIRLFMSSNWPSNLQVATFAFLALVRSKSPLRGGPLAACGAWRRAFWGLGLDSACVAARRSFLASQIDCLSPFAKPWAVEIKSFCSTSGFFN